MSFSTKAWFLEKKILENERSWKIENLPQGISFGCFFSLEKWE